MNSNQKQAIADELLAHGTLFVHFDPRVTDVVIPPWLRHQAQVVLQFGYDMPIDIPDLRVDYNGIYGTLSFSRTPFKCFVPWKAVFALVGDSERGMVWSESMPAEVAAEVERNERRARRDESAVVLKNTPPKLEYVKGGALLSTPARGVLRRVK